MRAVSCSLWNLREIPLFKQPCKRVLGISAHEPSPRLRDMSLVLQPCKHSHGSFVRHHPHTVMSTAHALQLFAQMLALLTLSRALQDYYAHRHGGKPPLYYPGGEFYYYQGYLPDKMQRRMHPTQIPLSCINSTLAGAHLPLGFQVPVHVRVRILP